jgi:hypothetical protein
MRDFDKNPYSADEARIAKWWSDLGVGGGDDPIGSLIASHEMLADQRNELQRTFDMMWEADKRAIKLWQAAHPGNDMVWPDRCKLTYWLIDEVERLKRSAAESL